MCAACSSVDTPKKACKISFYAFKFPQKLPQTINAIFVCMCTEKGSHKQEHSYANEYIKSRQKWTIKSYDKVYDYYFCYA